MTARSSSPSGTAGPKYACHKLAMARGCLPQGGAAGSARATRRVQGIVRLLASPPRHRKPYRWGRGLGHERLLGDLGGAGESRGRGSCPCGRAFRRGRAVGHLRAECSTRKRRTCCWTATHRETVSDREASAAAPRELSSQQARGGRSDAVLDLWLPVLASTRPDVDWTPMCPAASTGARQLRVLARVGLPADGDVELYAPHVDLTDRRDHARRSAEWRSWCGGAMAWSGYTVLITSACRIWCTPTGGVAEPAHHCCLGAVGTGARRARDYSSEWIHVCPRRSVRSRGRPASLFASTLRRQGGNRLQRATSCADGCASPPRYCKP